MRAFSAGGVVWRRRQHGAEVVVEVLLVGRMDRSLWALPKGTPQPGEAPQATALREVQEETGIIPRITGSLGTIAYTFLTANARIQKRVRHYLMEPTGGDLSLHDHEYDEVAWFPIEHALATLTHENEAIVVRRAADLIARRDARRQQSRLQPPKRPVRQGRRRIRSPRRPPPTTGGEK